MAADLGQPKRRAEPERTTELTPRVTKRPFDVAFLMLPDDRMKQRQLQLQQQQLQQQQQQPVQSRCPPALNNNDGDAADVDDSDTDRYEDAAVHGDGPRSAFTKVACREASRSPEAGCAHSLSPSPPAPGRPCGAFGALPFRPAAPAFHAFEAGALEAPMAPGPALLQQPALARAAVAAAAARPLLHYRPDLAPYAAYGGLHAAGMGDARHPAAAALLSSLLPPSFAALSLPAQNVCAKCNVSFRMTSDLVYHMRSHHKNDVVGDAAKRRREDKLRCPVCAESFRERHHLTRHMTAHQDKEGDALDPADSRRKPCTPFGTAK